MRRIKEVVGVGAIRVRSGFLFFPRAIRVEDVIETRWLERATWLEERVSLGLHESNGWHSVKWIEGPDAYA